jgi:hypothetical protein
MDSTIRRTVISTTLTLSQKMEQDFRNDEKQKWEPMSTQIQKAGPGRWTQENLEFRRGSNRSINGKKVWK